ncbi:MAG: helix-turn-helix domain-containing protein [Lachnospiraceae bacterium]|nr:helix-turn-helix domain-containing protein [Lachnospiraceae bacterium]
MLKNNLLHMRKALNLTQEDIAEKVGVSRQSVAKWESGETMPDLEKSRLLANTLGVSLDDLVSYDEESDPESDENMGLGIGPKGKHIFGVVTVGDKGQIVIPAKARKLFGIAPGDQLLVLGDEAQGLEVVKAEGFLSMSDTIRKIITR